MLEKLEGYHTESSRNTSVIEINNEIDIQIQSQSNINRSESSFINLTSLDHNKPIDV